MEKEKQKQKSSQDANATKPDLDEDDTASRGSANGQSQGARKRKAVVEANAEKANVEKERGELRRALDEDHLWTGTRPYDSEDGTRASRVKTSSMKRALRSVLKKGARSKEPEIVDLDEEESVSERVARLIAQQTVATGSSSPEGRKKPDRRSPRLSAKSDRSTGSDLRSGSLPKQTLKALSFAEALMSPTPEDQKARE